MRRRAKRDTVDLTWLILPAAVGVFALRTVLVARRLKAAAKEPALADLERFRRATQDLHIHRDELEATIASPKVHLASAKRFSRSSVPGRRARGSNLDRMVEDFLPERRL